MLFVILGIIAICALLCGVEGIVCLWERLAAPKAPARPVRRAKVIPLPDRACIGTVYSLSEQFADRFREVVHS